VYVVTLRSMPLSQSIYARVASSAVRSTVSGYASNSGMPSWLVTPNP